MSPDTPDSLARGAHPAVSVGGTAPPTAFKLGDRVRRLRRARGWTLDEAAGRCGLSRAALSKIERERMSPTFGALQKIAQGFGFELSELIAQCSDGKVSECRIVEALLEDERLE